MFELDFTSTYQSQRSKMEMKEVAKLEQAIDVHGYRGNSKKKHNGVVNIRPQDKQLIKDLAKFKSLEQESTGLDEFVMDVKVVAHCPSGNRIVASLYKTPTGHKLRLFGFSNYSKKLFV
jgi:hypothetical protein